jgi:SSS family solute:Na+ symporter
MQTADIVVVIGYFVAMLVIGVACAFRMKSQEDFFMGGRGFGKLLQTFAAFGSGTGAQEPIKVGRTVWTSGLSGIWSALMWLYVTPFYWIFGTWYRRMRHLTLGDWFVERYESRALGAAYTVFGFSFYVFFLSTTFSAISKVAAPLLGDDTVKQVVAIIGSQDPNDLKYVLVPFVASVVAIYGIVGGLTAAYWMDLLQGICIIVLSVILVPFGLDKLIRKFGEQYAIETGQSFDNLRLWDGFSILHSRLGEEYFQLFSGPQSGEFPLHFIISFSLLGLLGIVVQPHFITVGGGSAKSEYAARVGLVTGNFLKRFCSLGWALSGLIVLALVSDNLMIIQDPDLAWGIGSREILGDITVGGVPIGLVGLMFACLLAALMASSSCYMLVTSALLVRNIYAPYFAPNASERRYVALGRLSSFVIITGAAIVSLLWFDVFAQYKLALEIAILFAAPFWVGMFWRRANTWAAWTTILTTFAFFFVVPTLLPALFPSMRTNQTLMLTTDNVTSSFKTRASPADIARRQASITLWDTGVENRGPRPLPLTLGEEFVQEFASGGTSLYWGKGLEPVGETTFREISRTVSEDGAKSVLVTRIEGHFQGKGQFLVDFYLYSLLGIDLHNADNALLSTFRIPLKLIFPFVVMITVSLISPSNSQSTLDRYYVKMKTPVQPTPSEDERELLISYNSPQRFENSKLFPGTSLEFQRPSKVDLLGFIACVIICGVFLLMANWLSKLGA